MRVLFVHEVGGYQGGVEQNVAASADALCARGHQCALAFERPGKDSAAYIERFDITAGFEELSQSWRPDVVYLHKVADSSFLSSIVGRIRTVRMVHDHDLCCPRKHKYFLNGQTCRQAAGWRCVLDLAFLNRIEGNMRYYNLAAHMTELRRSRALDCYLVGSRFMVDELRMNGFPPERVHTLAPVVDVRARPSALPAARRILYVGQLVRGKGIDLMIEALPLVPGDWHVTLVGDGYMRGQLEAQVHRLGLQDRVHFAGWIPHEALDTVYDESRVVVVPSRWPEPFGMVGVEAMARSRPVVAFATGGIPDWLVDGETGLLVAEQDVPGMGRALTRVLDEEGLAERLGNRGCEVAVERYAAPAYIERLESFLAG